MAQPVQMVCFGNDNALLATRRAVLALHFNVTPVSTLAQLLGLTLSQPFALFVLCHTLSLAEHTSAVQFIHRSWPAAGIVALTTIGGLQYPTAADHTLGSLEGPEALIAMVRLTLHEKHSHFGSQPGALPSPAMHPR